MSIADDTGRRPLPPDLGRLLHDLRGPLNSLTMHAEVLKRTVRDDRAAEDSLRTLLEQLGRLAEMLPAAFYVASLELGSSTMVDLGAAAGAAQQAAGGVVQLAPGRWPLRPDSSCLVCPLAAAALARRPVKLKVLIEKKEEELTGSFVSRVYRSVLSVAFRFNRQANRCRG